MYRYLILCLVPLFAACNTIETVALAHSEGNQPVVIIGAGANTGLQIDQNGLSLGRQHFVTVYAVGTDGDWAQYTFNLKDSENAGMFAGTMFNGLDLIVTVMPVADEPLNALLE